MIEFLFGLSVFCAILYIYFSRDLKPVDEDKCTKDRTKNVNKQSLVYNSEQFRNDCQLLAEKLKNKEKKKNFFYDKVTKRWYSRSWISSLVPHTKKNSFWLVERKDKQFNAIEIIRDFIADEVTIRFWFNNQLHGVELHFYCFENCLEINRYDKGKKGEIKTDKEQYELLKSAEDLYNFFRSSSSYVKDLNIENQLYEYDFE